MVTALAGWLGRLVESLVIGGLVRLFYDPPRWAGRASYDRGWTAGAFSLSVLIVVAELLGAWLFRRLSLSLSPPDRTRRHDHAVEPPAAPRPTDAAPGDDASDARGPR